ncbi:hypothetical protein I79_026024 [Cricetulus griseus]|uniref:Uncharacterized protein n=1 Tax=Cricetulus griseus TaxID=10029 RepID=G3IPU6_CRIGR|nr:hypothetical protein I79_026024 [Cricetulus griseus]
MILSCDGDDDLVSAHFLCKALPSNLRPSVSNQSAYYYWEKFKKIPPKVGTL